ncbi:MAG: hypothetical protein KDC53_12050 [Saprospiraceae bacterium]|nr:hypothetical protein [Saprospiraceae bacterium]
MRTRLVFWGKNAQDERVLLGFKLNEEENNVDLYIFPESETTEDFVNQMHDHWRLGQDLLFPEDHIHQTMPLSITGSLLPDGYTIERDDILKRAQTEWQFIVLSARLYKTYREELDDFKDKFQKLSKFDPNLFEDLKGFWGKVQEQVREKNLFKDHADKIRKHTDALFDDLKRLRKAFDQEFQQLSDKHLTRFKEQLEAVEHKIEEGLSLQNIFQELKDIQRSFRNTDFTNEHRSQLWKKIDGLFKVVKEKKFGKEGESGKSDPLSRLQRRYDGLKVAIEKMERSIKRDRKELEFQTQRMEDSDGSLESQLRAAKTKMIAERVDSKEEKLAEMQKTEKDLDRRMESLKKKRDQQQLEEKLKAEIKEKIAHDIKEAEKARSDDETIQKAAEAIVDQDSVNPVTTEEITTAKKEDSSQTEEGPLSLEEKIGDTMEDIVDTVKAVAAVIEHKFEDLIDDWKKEEE